MRRHLPSLGEAIDCMQSVTAALSSATEAPGLSPEDVAAIAAVFEEAHQLREKLMAIDASLLTGRVRTSRIPPVPEDT
jgi:hypothetical protein